MQGELGGYREPNIIEEMGHHADTYGVEPFIEDAAEQTRKVIAFIKRYRSAEKNVWDICRFTYTYWKKWKW